MNHSFSAAEIKEASSLLGLLTDKEREALELTAQHLSSKDIARLLGVSPKAIDQRLDSARAKLGVGRRSEAAKRYRELTDPSERLPYQAFLLADSPKAHAELRSVPAEAVYTLGDTATFGPGVPWGGSGPVRHAPKFWERDIRTVPLHQVGLLILVTAVLLLVLTVLGLAAADGVTDLMRDG